MLLAPGTRLGHYEVVEQVGAGGMGEVYRARDPRVGRDVAIKVSAEQFSERFEREARVIASLNHPNICSLYDVGPNYLVMEFVEGPTLADQIKQGAIPSDNALGIAQQIANALEAAHEKNIVHRDLKPGNVKITPDGTVKVLDFGLAKIGGTPSARTDESPTLTAGMTQAGMILGTAAYMAPEQARGRTVDSRADIWAFGVVLYEMLTGRRLFQGEDITETIAAVVKEQPDWTPIPTHLRRLLKSCLEKDPKKRLQAIGDMRLLLEDARPIALHSSDSRFTKLAWAAAGAAVLSAAVLAVIHFSEAPTQTPLIRSTILPPDGATFDFGEGVGLPALSPDGTRIVFGATADGKTPLWVRSLDGLTGQPLAGTEGATFPFWSPDGRWIAFFSSGSLKKIDASGGPVLTLTNAERGRGGTWSRDGVIVFAPSNTLGPLLKVSSAGGAASAVSKENGSFPWFLPDGQHFLFQEQGGGDQGLPIRVGSLDGAPSKLVGTGSNPLYAQDRLLFLRENTLMAQPFDAARLTSSGEAVPLAERVQSVLNSGRAGAFTVSTTGLLAYREGGGAPGRVLTWVDRDGKPGASFGDPAPVGNFRFSPDRKRVAATLQQGGNNGDDIWIYDVARGLRTRLTFDEADDDSPVWSPDGRSIVFSSYRKGHYDIYRKIIDSVGATEELLYEDGLDKAPTSLSTDGKLLLYDVSGRGSKTGRDIWALPLTPEKPGSALKPFPVLQSTLNEDRAYFSPDGKWILYISENEAYVTPFPPPASGPGGKRQISTAGASIARWRDDGREIFYLGPNRQLVAAQIAINGAALEVGEVRALFSIVTPRFDVSADGQRFILLSSPEQRLTEPLTLIQNWAVQLRR